VVNCDDITTVAQEDLLEPIGYLSSAQERALADAIAAAFDLDFDPAFSKESEAERPLAASRASSRSPAARPFGNG
jgi:hypothetical protein